VHLGQIAAEQPGKAVIVAGSGQTTGKLLKRVLRDECARARAVQEAPQ
jgi:hypothetical protein